MNELTIIIPFLNEGEEIDNTLKSIRDTAKDKVDILIINDCCTDGYDYEKPAARYQAVHYKNKERLGVAASRDVGVSMCQTPYFLLLDGHMRFFQDDWLEKTLAVIKQDHRAIYCLQCKNLLPDFSIDESIATTMGAYVNLTEEESGFYILEPHWKHTDPEPEKSVIKIPSVLGAGYAAHKDYWQYLRGLEGLRTYGSDEPFISIKAWLEGGCCYLLKEVIVGHIFRNTSPFPIDYTDRAYNKLLMAELFLPLYIKKDVSGKLLKERPEQTKKAMALLIENKGFIKESKKYFQKIFTRDIESFISFNDNSWK